jgi:hypothetical protein
MPLRLTRDVRTIITGLQGHTVSTRQTNVRAAVEKQLLVLESILTGFDKRSTLIAPLKQADIDIVVVLTSATSTAEHATSLNGSARRCSRPTRRRK